MVHSLRARLLLWLLVPLAAFVVVTSGVSYDAARQTADLLQDHTLLDSARTIIEDVGWDDGALNATIPPAALELFESPWQDHVFYKVLAGNGRLLGGAPDLPLPPVSSAVQPVFYDSAYAPWPTSGCSTTRAAPNTSRSSSARRLCRARR